MKEGGRMEEPKRSLKESLQLMHENNQKVNLFRLESDASGNYLLDPSNIHHREWVESVEDNKIMIERE